MGSYRTLNRRYVLSAIAAVLVLAGGCGEKSHQPTPPALVSYGDQDSPQACLRILQQAYIHRDAERHAGLFPGDFVFVFLQVDTEPPWPEWWDLAGELASTTRMFASELVRGISLSFDQGDPVPSDVFPGTRRVEVTNIELVVETRKADGIPLAMTVASGHGAFYFKEYPEELTPGGQPTWRIWRWEDLGVTPTSRAKLVRYTWGGIKWHFS